MRAGQVEPDGATSVRATDSSTSAVLPSDLLIFSPDWVTQALCIQNDANGRPTARDWASSFSWCGKRRSSPPPWMSKDGPRYLPAIAEHSMCQPGRPGPQGEFQAAVAGSPALVAFHSAKSRGSRLPRSSTSAPVIISSAFWPDSSPYAGQLATSK